MCSLLAALWVKSTVVMALHPFDPESFFAIIEGDLCPTWYYAAPTIHKALLLGATCTSVHSHLRFIRSGAGPLPHRDAVALSRLFRCTVVSSYSMTECMPICSTTILAKPDTVGLPVGPSLRIADTNGCALPYDKIGEVLIRGPGVMKGYEKESEKRKHTSMTLYYFFDISPPHNLFGDKGWGGQWYESNVAFFLRCKRDRGGQSLAVDAPVAD